MNNPVTIEELKKVYGLSELPEEHLAWLIERGELLEYEEGALLGRTGMPAEKMFIIIEGKFDFYMDVNGTLVYYLTFENERNSGGISGLIPHSRMKTYPGNAFAVGPVRVLALHKKYFAELEKLNPEFIQRLIGYMTERARTFA